MTVDEILATGQYRDRRGREWDYFDTRVDYDRWKRWESRGEEDLILDTDEMRLLIERDQHRDECEGLRTCVDHPVPHVVSYLRQAGVIQAYPADRNHGGQRSSVYRQFPEAMDAARALAVGA
jgi:hypothetical protein